MRLTVWQGTPTQDSTPASDGESGCPGRYTRRRKTVHQLHLRSHPTGVPLGHTTEGRLVDALLLGVGSTSGHSPARTLAAQERGETTAQTRLLQHTLGNWS